MGCKASKILHDEPCTCQHKKNIRHDDIVVVRSPSPASSFYNSNTSTYSAETRVSDYSNSSNYSSNSDETTSRQPFLRTTCDHHSQYPSYSNYSDYSEQQTLDISRTRMRKETVGRSYKNKPLPRRNRSGREIKFFMPKSSLSQRRRRSIEASRDRDREPEDPGPWAMTEHNKLVPIMQPINRFNNTINANNVANSNNTSTGAGIGAGIGVGAGAGISTGTATATGTSRAAHNEQNTVTGNGLSLRKNRLPNVNKGAPANDYIVTGGYVVSPEVYYASLPLPDLPPPPPRHLEPAPMMGANKAYKANPANPAMRNEVIHQQLKQNAEIVQARRVKEYTKEYTGTKISNRF